MISENTAIVYTGSYALYTKDDFETIQYHKYKSFESTGRWEVQYFDGLNVWLQTHNSFSFPQYRNISYKLVQTQTTSNLDLTIFFTATNTLPIYYSAVPSFYDSATLLFARADISGTNFYMGDIFKNTASLVSSLRTTDISVGVYSTKNLVLYLTDSYAGYNYYTTSDLVSWQGPFPLSIDYSEEVMSISSNDKLLVMRIRSSKNFDSTGKLSYRNMYSTDKGKTWSSFAGLTSDPIDVKLLPDGSIYAIIDANTANYSTRRLAKSFDNGKSWTLENKEFYANSISFYDQKNGLAVYGSLLQVTNDGGKNWKLILN
jgi:hypothetical protein